jgi:acetolactate synthase I/II/III large subunit
VEHAIAADVGEAFAVLAEAPARTTAFAGRRPPAAERDGEGAHAVDREVHPGALIRALGRSMPPRCRVVSDIGTCMLWAIRELTLADDQAFFVPMSLGSMGSGIGAAVGLQIRSPAVPTLCLAGDCAMLMLGGELHTASAAGGHPIKVVVLNDGGHGTVDAGLGLLGLRGASVRFPDRVDFASWARALHFDAHVVRTNGDLARFDWASFWSGATPSLVDVHVDPSVPPPLDLRIKGLCAPGLVS